MTSSCWPAMRCARHHPATRSTARSMWPLRSQSGSKSGDLFGIVMYSLSVGTIESANSRSTSAAARCESIARTRVSFRQRLHLIHGEQHRRGLHSRDAYPSLEKVRLLPGAEYLRDRPIHDQTEVRIVAPNHQGVGLEREQVVSEREADASVSLESFHGLADENDLIRSESVDLSVL